MLKVTSDQTMVTDRNARHTATTRYTQLLSHTFQCHSIEMNSMLNLETVTENRNVIDAPLHWALSIFSNMPNFSPYVLSYPV